MQFFIDFAEKDEEFNRILERAAKYPTVQGVVLDIDRYWIRAWQIRQCWGDDVVARNAPRFDDLAFARHPFFYPSPITLSDIDNWRPPRWDEHQDRFGLRKEGPPWVAKVCLRPRAHADEPIPRVEELRDGEARVRVELETRSQAELASNPRRHYRPVPGGVSIGVSDRDFGTMGVTLRDDRGRLYALTCSHVVPKKARVIQPARRDGSGAIIGASIEALPLNPCSLAAPCNPWSSVSANELDLSLVEIDPQSAAAALEVLDIGPLKRVARRASLSTEQAVEVMGRTTGYSVLQIGGLAAWYRLRHGNNAYCFKNLFEVESPYGRAPSIRPGDSGAPVCTAGPDGKAWCGMIVGCDMYKGFALYAETAQLWLSQNLPPLHLS